MPRAKPAARLLVLEAILERGRSCVTAAKLAGVSPEGARRWLGQHTSGRLTLEALRANPEVTRVMSGGWHQISRLRPSASLRQVIDRVRSLGGEGLSGVMLLKMTAPYALHEDAPIDHFSAWLRFAARECDFV